MKMLTSTGKPIASIFEGLRPSPLGRLGYRTTDLHTCRPAKTARAQSDQLPARQAFVRAVSLSLSGEQQARYLPVQSCCGGHYAACFEDFCTTDCTYLFC